MAEAVRVLPYLFQNVVLSVWALVYGMVAAVREVVERVAQVLIITKGVRECLGTVPNNMLGVLDM